MYKNNIGSKSEKVKNIVERGAVKKFAESIGDLHPLFIDEEYAKTTRFQRNVAPITFPRVFDYGTIENLKLPAAGLIHGEQTYHYNRPLYVGEEIYCYSAVEDYYEKTGNSGTMGFLSIKGFGEDEMGNVIFSSTQVVILTEAVRKGLTV